MRKSAAVFLSVILIAVLLCGCCDVPPGGNAVTEEDLAEGISEEAAGVENSEKDSETEALPGFNANTNYNKHNYVHGDEGYYCLLEDGVDYELAYQVAGTCWICAASCAMITGYQLKHEGTVGPFDQRKLVDEIYDKDVNGGVSVGSNGYNTGGAAVFVINELSQGFGDGYVLDEAIEAKEFSMDEIKEGIQKYGALYIGIPDSNKRYITLRDGYDTLNWTDPEEADYDHSIAVIGWDDHFPKENFSLEASRDGAWITYNSNIPRRYYYVSYDTPIDLVMDPPVFLSVSDEYSMVLTHDSGRWTEDTAGSGKTVTANIFEGEGTLTAVGTYITKKDSDLIIEIMTPDLKEVLYSQSVHADMTGYCVFQLNTPVEVDRFAVAVTYPDGAPVEGESMDLDWAQVETGSGEGESFILIGDEWLDLSSEAAREKTGFITNNACIRALYANN